MIGLGYVDNNTSEAIASKAVAKATAAAARAATATPPLPTQAHRHVWREPIHPPLPNLPSSNKPSKRQTWVAAVIDGIAEEFRRNPKSVYFGEGTGERGGSYQHTRGLWAEFGPERLIDTGISELAFTGAAMGLAACGCRAVADTMTVDFMLGVINNANRIRSYMQTISILLSVCLFAIVQRRSRHWLSRRENCATCLAVQRAFRWLCVAQQAIRRTWDRIILVGKLLAA